jgi:hypothetical protein
MSDYAAQFESGWGLWRPVVLRAPGFPSQQAERLCSPLLAQAADRLADQPDSGGEKRCAYRALFAAETDRLGSVMLDIAQEPRFQFALGWQNHKLVDEAIVPMLRHAGRQAPRNSKRRQREDLVANYWQRYCLKNDTIGFFGPVGWGSLDDALTGTRLTAGRSLISSSETFFETWAIDALARVIAAEPGMTEWVHPWLVPYVKHDGDQIVRPAGAPIGLSAAEIAVVRRVDGLTRAGQIADEVAADPAIGCSRSDVLEILSGLRRRRVLTWKLQLPLSPHPERDLRKFLESVGDPGLAACGLAKLDRFEAARDRVSATAEGSDPACFVAALRALDDLFVELTGASPSRNGGKAYGGRTLVYHDARRDVDFTLGSDFLAALAPLDLLLQSARWLTYRFRLALDAEFGAIVDRLAGQDNQPVSLASFWFECLSLLHKTARGIADRLQLELRQRWAEILRCPPDEPRVRLSVADLREAVAEAFDAPHSGWPGGRYCSPDVLVAAADEQAIQRGDFELVIGEMHLALASLRHHCFVLQHPRRSELFDCLTADDPGPKLVPAAPKEDSGRLTLRTQPALTRDQDYLVAMFDHPVDASRPRLLRAADLQVTPTPAGLRVLVGDDLSFDVADAFSEMMTNVIMDKFAIFPEQPHLPRVTIDRMVISRETWRFPAADLAFAATPDEADRYAAARAWLRACRLPTQVFVKVPGEIKPFFVDFDSPPYVSLLAKAVRRLLADQEANGTNPIVQVSEMLPSMRDLWVTDSEGNRYTSECRIVAVDTRGP